MKLLKRYSAILLAVVMLFGASLTCQAAETTPFKEHILPGTVHFCDVDMGEPNVSYSKPSGIIGTYKYRDDLQLNFYKDAIGAIVGSGAPTWYVHTVQVSKTGIYAIKVRSSSPTNGLFQMEIDGVLVGMADLLSSGSYQSTIDSPLAEVELTEGTHVIKFTHLTGSANLSSMIFDYLGEKNKLDLKPTSGAYRKHYLPTRIEGEDFDVDGYYSLDGKNNPEKYRKDAAIDIDETKDGDRRTFVYCQKEEYVSYTFEVENSAAYRLSAHAVGNGQLTVLIDGVQIASKVDLQSDAESGGNEIVNVWLPKGEHTMRVLCENESFSVDYFEFVANLDESISLNQQTPGAQTPVSDNIYRTLYVNPNGNDENDGSKQAPFATVKRAVEEISKINKNMTGDIVVSIASGEYYLPEKLTIDEKSGGQNGYRVIFKGEDIFNQPIIHGGKKITGWKKQENSPIWVAPADHVEDTRTLYINDLAATLAKSRYYYRATGYYKAPNSPYVSDGMTISKTNFPKGFKNPEDVMLGWNVLWATHRSAVDDIIFDEQNCTFIMKQPEWNVFTNHGFSHSLLGTSKQFFIENALEVLDEPGEFYFDKADKKIYYYPYENEDLTTAATYVGTTEKLLYVGGDAPGNKISDVEFRNLCFKYGALNEVSKNGAKFNQTDNRYLANETGSYYVSTMFEAQITVNHAENVTIQNCRFACLGSNALNLDNGVKNAKVIGNVFTDLSGAGIVVGHFLHTDYPPVGHERVENVEVCNNVIRRPAQEYMATTAIALYFPKNVTVSHNDIKETPYSGIVAGWGWGRDAKDNRDIRITHNRVEKVMQKLVDGAHIYTLGRMENSHISNNYLINTHYYAGGIYLDEGTEALTIENNVVEQSNVHLYARLGVGIQDNVARNNYTTAVLDKVAQAACKETGVVRVSGDNWPEEALKIMEEAGLEPMYRYLLNGVEYPDWRIELYRRYPKEEFKSEEIYDVNKWILGESYTDFHEISGKVPNVYGGGEIGDTRPGEWVEFTVNVHQSDTYQLSIRGGDGWGKDDPICTAKLELDGVVLADDIVIPRQNWKLVDIPVGNVDLKAGVHKFRMTVQGNDWLVGGFKFDNGKLLPDSSDYDEGSILSEAELKELMIEFTDIDKHWAAYEIRQLAADGVIKGYDKATFAPNDTVTLHQACLLALRALKKDTSGNWQTLAYEAGMLTSTDEEDGAISRERFADVVMKAYVYYFGNYQITVDGSDYSDINDADVNYLYSIQGAKELGFIVGYPDNTFRPKNTLTRAEAAMVILSLFNKL